MSAPHGAVPRQQVFWISEADRDNITGCFLKLLMPHGSDVHPNPPERSIFVVDDEPDDRGLFQRLLREAGNERPSVFFSDGEQMIDALIGVLRGAPMPVACFLDVKMAGMSGFDVLRWIRCQRSLDNIVVVMLSSSDHPRDLNEALQFGAQCYLAKFPSAGQLREMLAELDRVAAAATISPFRLPCNLLLTSSAASVEG